DAIAAATNNSVRVLVLSVNDVPVLTGLPAGHVGAQTGGQNVSLLPQALLGDPDQNAVLANNNGENLTWSVTLSGSNPIGSLMLGGIDIGTTYATSGDPVAVTAALRSLAYHAPTLAIGGTNAMTLALTAADGHGGTVSSNVFIDVFSVVSPPGLTGTQSGQIVNDNTTIALFSKVGIQSFNGNFVTVQLALYGVTNDDQGQLFNLSSFTRATLPGATSLYSYTGTSEGATAAIRSILFQPTPNRIGGSTSETVTLGIRLIDGALTNNLDTSTSVIVVPVNDAPAIAGITSLTLITDSQTTNPFTGVLISDVDELGQQPVSAVVTLDDPAKGTLSVNNQTNTGFNGTNGIYFFSGTPAALTAAIRKLVFVPTPGRVPYGLSEITTFTISLNDNHGGIVANGATAVRVTPVNGLPVVTLPAPQPVSFPVGPNIFALQGVSIADATVLKVYITINTNAGVVGKFTTNSIAAAGFTALTNGSYFISGSASNVTAAVQLLDFSPATNFPPGSVTNYFVISATNSTLTPAGITVTHAVVLRTVPSSFIVTKLTDYDPSGSVADSLKAGTLRKAIAAAKNNDHITFDIRSTEAGQPDYPAVIRLVAPVALDKNLTFDGPGAERLSISGDTNANGTADVQLFTVNALVTMNRLTFTKGYAPDSGGAFEVNEFGALVLSYCAVTDCAADVWGGGVDVNQGSLVLDHCLVAGNRTSGTFGQGGGGVSYYTYWPCAILDTTFATNRQNAVGGLGGGAIYAETADSGTEFDLYVLNSTFRDNRDTAGHGSSFRPNVFNTIVQLQNTIVADGQGKNIEMDFSGALLSLGGNISDDATATIFSSGGAATNTFIFHSPADQVNVPATNVLAALANNGGPTLTYALSAGSPAIDNVISNFPGAAAYAALGTDQRGYFRSFSNNLPDIGAFERGAAQRVVIQELRVNPGANDVTNQFIEFYVPRDSTNVNFGGFQVLVDGVLRHTFANEWLQPGEALVLFSKDAANTGVPSVVHSQIAATNLLMNKFSGVVSLLNPAGQLVFAADYVGSFTATDTNDYGHLAVNYQSLVLSPSFQGVFLPYQRAVAKMGVTVIETNLSDPGHDPAGNLIGIGNAPPIAYADLTSTDAP
ncbi:MAG: choice-of-anchor Q domain-containing protein, partial [Verrucomicrobiota bacterium]